MIKKLLLTVCTTLCCSFLYGKQDWKLVWNDEFDYSGAPDNSKWSFDTEGNNWDWGNNEAQNYTPADNKNAWVEDGNLIIEARKESYRWYGDGQTKEYTSARLITKGKGDWLYGKVEVKALLPTGNGMWPAIWMLSTDDTYGGWPNSGELDIMENVGFDPNKIHCNIHTEAYNHKNGTNKGNTVSTTDPSKNWHVYSMEWDAEQVSFFLDGSLVFQFKNEHKSYKEWPYDKRFHLLLNIAVGGSWGGEKGINDGIFPQRMLVDYVRVYQYGEVEDEPVDGVLKLNTSIAENTCSGESLEIAIDTTGTGKLLQPDKLEIKVSEYYKNSNSSNDLDMSKATVDEKGMIKLYIKPQEDVIITTQIKYLDQSIDTVIPVKVYPRPVIASVDSIGPRDVMVVLENYDYEPYLYALDRNMFYYENKFCNLEARDYVVSVKDANGCVAQYQFSIKEPTAVELIAGDNISVYSNGNNVI
ncbi:MAG: glycoside hydrolase family 16 protein, partial [Paludibacteraceae bacterium]|nr:glycoside hydrolase family 16 protein [Paludibacteraceae bacterium]